jgi:hypothetical protein
MRILDACLYWALDQENIFKIWEFTVCAPSEAHRATSVFILTLQACVWLVHRLAADTEHTATLSMIECGLNEISEWGSSIAGC